MDGGWWEGTSNRDGKRGYFPDNYVKVISNNVNSTSAGTPLRGKKFKVKYNYIPANLDELELHVNDVVEVISEIEEGWWEGKLRNTIGVFPSNFVTEISDAELAAEKENHSAHINQLARDTSKAENEDKVPSKNVTTNDGPVLPPKPKQVKEMCIALFPYEAKHEDELTLKENDVILLLSTDLPDKGWWKGQLNGKIGVFPDNFVKLIAIEEEVSKADKMNALKTTNKISDAVPKLPSYTVAASRKSKQPEDITNVTKKPVVSKKPTTQSVETLKSLPEKISTSPEKSINTSANSIVEVSPLSKSDHDKSKTDSPNTSSHDLLRGKSFSMSASMNEKLNAEMQATFAAKEAETVDGGLNSKVYKINDDKITVKNETVSVKIEPSNEKEVDLNFIGRSELLTHPTASRAKAPKRRPPSVINFKEEDDVVVINNKIVDTSKSVVTVNGTTELVHEKVKSAPWVQELKLNQAKKNSTQVNLKSGFTSTGSNVMFRPQRPVSVCAGETEQSANLIYQKPIVTAINDTPVGIVASDNKSDKVITISANEWNALNEKVNNLELRLETQAEFFRKTIDQLKIKLAKEIENRLEMKNEMDKLMDLVTQV